MRLQSHLLLDRPVVTPKTRSTAQRNGEVPVMRRHLLNDVGLCRKEVFKKAKRHIENQPLSIVAVVRHGVHSGRHHLLTSALVLVDESF